MTMDNILDMLVADESPVQVSDEIKNILFTKAAERVNAFRPNVADTMFGTEEETEEEYEETEE